MNGSTSSLARNALTVDVEDYFHVWAFRDVVFPEHWDSMECRVERNTHKVLELLAEFRLYATFFILGWVAERYPFLVRDIVAAGHEVGCHSYSHRLVYDLTPDEFRADTRHALKAIEDVAGVQVRAYRAPSFSITARSLWAIEILLELGFSIDSSVFPSKNCLYGIAGAPRRPFRIRLKGSELVEFPAATLQIGRWAIPVTGGAYLRLLPYWYQVLALNAMARQAEPAVLYFHPWELDPDQPVVASPFGSRFYHYVGLKRTERRLRGLFGRFRFARLSDSIPTTAPVYEVALGDKRSGHGSMLKVLAQ
jgi:polysaccharide deacetylase family protein (PEP-CTERM system associated)